MTHPERAMPKVTSTLEQAGLCSYFCISYSKWDLVSINENNINYPQRNPSYIYTHLASWQLIFLLNCFMGYNYKNSIHLSPSKTAISYQQPTLHLLFVLFMNISVCTQTQKYIKEVYFQLMYFFVTCQRWY